MVFPTEHEPNRLLGRSTYQRLGVRVWDPAGSQVFDVLDGIDIWSPSFWWRCLCSHIMLHLYI